MQYKMLTYLCNSGIGYFDDSAKFLCLFFLKITTDSTVRFSTLNFIKVEENNFHLYFR